MMKLGTVMPYLKKIQKICKPRDASLNFCSGDCIFFPQKPIISVKSVNADRSSLSRHLFLLALIELIIKKKI